MSCIHVNINDCVHQSPLVNSSFNYMPAFSDYAVHCPTGEEVFHSLSEAESYCDCVLSLMEPDDWESMSVNVYGLVNM